MARRIGRQAVVIGAGMAGLPAARALADFFERVVVIENDALSGEVGARPGTPQARHLHALLAGGERALSSLFPGFEEDVRAAGGLSLSVAGDYCLERPGYAVFPQRDLGFRILSMTRPLVEAVVRRRVAGFGNIELWERCRAQRLLTTEGGAVRGVECLHADGAVEPIGAELVVDASSHGQLTMNLLASMGFAAPEETTVGVNMGYATAVFEIPENAPSQWKVAICYADPPRNRRGALLMPAEDNTWLVALLGSHDTKPGDDEAGFLEYARQLRTQTIYGALKGARRRGPAARHGFKASRWRRFEKLDRFPAGLAPFGDTICRFNPIYGQGMSVGAKEAVALREVLQGVADGEWELEAVGREFLTQAQPIIDAPWATAVVPDFLDPLTVGEPPADLAGSLRFGAALTRIAFEDVAMHRLMLEVQHMLKPRSVLRAPEVVERVRAVLSAA